MKCRAPWGVTWIEGPGPEYVSSDKFVNQTAGVLSEPSSSPSCDSCVNSQAGSRIEDFPNNISEDEVVEVQDAMNAVSRRGMIAENLAQESTGDQMDNAELDEHVLLFMKQTVQLGSAVKRNLANGEQPQLWALLVLNTVV